MTSEAIGEWDSRLQCRIEQLYYDWSKRELTLALPDLNCTDMRGAIALAVGIDVGVRRIVALEGPLGDATTYELRQGDGVNWTAQTVRVKR